MKDIVVKKNGTVVGNPPTVFFSTQDDDFAGKLLVEFVCALP